MKLLPESIQLIENIRKLGSNKKIAFVSGNFNVIHPGHLRLLRFAKEFADFLVVGVLDSNSADAYVAESLRLEGIKSISWVDFGFIFREDPVAFIAALKPEFVVKGKEWEVKENPEGKVVAGYGGKLIFGSGEISFSSVDIIRQELNSTNRSTIRKPKDFPERHGFSHLEILDIIEKIKDLRIGVIGDTIVDEYITCDPLGMSQEDPSIVVTPVVQVKFIGGAAIVAAHARSLGAKVHFFSVKGEDPVGAFVQENLDNLKVSANLYIDTSRPTTLKQRFRAAQKTLLRVTHLRQHSIGQEIREQMFMDILKVLDEIQLLIFSDFNYGCLPQSLVDQIVAECSRRKIMMVADSQTSSQLGDISRFHNMTLITPTEKEARISLHDKESGLIGIADKLKSKANAKNVIITLGSEGILVHSEINEKNSWLTDQLPAFNTSPKDVAGAGDSFLVSTSMGMALGFDIWKSSYLGSIAAACQVSQIGNIPLSPSDLISEIRSGL